MVHLNSIKNLIGSSRAPRPRINAVMQHRVLDMLVDGATKGEIEEQTGMGTAAIRHYIQALHKPADGRNLVYVCDYVEDIAGRRTIKKFKWGPGKEDVPFAHITREEKTARAVKAMRARRMNKRIIGFDHRDVKEQL